jgi:hypothetical protein
MSIDILSRAMRASVLKLAPLAERFKDFIRRRLAHAEAVGDGYLPEHIIVGSN